MFSVWEVVGNGAGSALLSAGDEDSTGAETVSVAADVAILGCSSDYNKVRFEQKDIRIEVDNKNVGKIYPRPEMHPPPVSLARPVIVCGV
jgi:hypothetical protein